MKSFLITGVIGSTLYALFYIFSFAMNTGFFDWWALALGLPFGITAGLICFALFKLGAFAGEKLFKLSTTPPRWLSIGFSLLSVLIGFILYSLVHFILMV